MLLMFFILECFIYFSQLHVMMLNANLKATTVMIITNKYYFTLLR